MSCSNLNLKANGCSLRPSLHRAVNACVFELFMQVGNTDSAENLKSVAQSEITLLIFLCETGGVSFFKPPQIFVDLCK